MSDVTSLDYTERDSLGGFCPDEVEQFAVEHITDALYDCGYADNNFDIVAIRVFGSRMTDDLYRDDSDLDILFIYDADIRDDDMFSIVNDPPLEIAGIICDIFPERDRNLEYMMRKDAEHQEEKRSE